MKKHIDLIAEMNHFGLEDDPFGKVSGERVFRSRNYRKTLRLIENWIRRGEMGAIIGPPGSGKTTLLNDLAKHCTGRGDLILIHVGHPGRKEVYFNCVYEALTPLKTKFGKPFARSNQIKFHQLRELLGTELKDKHVGLILDEAHRYRAEFMRGMKEFTEMVYADRTDLLSVLFVGWRGFEENCRRYAPDIHARLRVGRKIIEVDDLMKGETNKYLEHRAKDAGNAKLFHATALNAISVMAARPTDINEIAWNSMDVAYKAGDRQVTAGHVAALYSPAEIKAALGVTLEQIAERTSYEKTAISNSLQGKYEGKPIVGDQVSGVLVEAMGAGGIDKVPLRQTG